MSVSNRCRVYNAYARGPGDDSGGRAYRSWRRKSSAPPRRWRSCPRSLEESSSGSHTLRRLPGCAKDGPITAHTAFPFPLGSTRTARDSRRHHTQPPEQPGAAGRFAPDRVPKLLSATAMVSSSLSSSSLSRAALWVHEHVAHQLRSDRLTELDVVRRAEGVTPAQRRPTRRTPRTARAPCESFQSASPARLSE